LFHVLILSIRLFSFLFKCYVWKKNCFYFLFQYFLVFLISYNKNKVFLFNFCIFVWLDVGLKFGKRRQTSFCFKYGFFHDYKFFFSFVCSLFCFLVFVMFFLFLLRWFYCISLFVSCFNCYSIFILYVFIFSMFKCLKKVFNCWSVFLFFLLLDFPILYVYIYICSFFLFFLFVATLFQFIYFLITCLLLF
jgi:hypothetical protein